MDNELLNKMIKIDEKLDKILKIIEKNTENCEKMSDHIDFIENIYENIKNPLGYICNKVKAISGNNTYSLENS